MEEGRKRRMKKERVSMRKEREKTKTDGDKGWRKTTHVPYYVLRTIGAPLLVKLPP